MKNLIASVNSFLLASLLAILLVCSYDSTSLSSSVVRSSLEPISLNKND